jgi:hypothetical protein
VAWRKAAAGGTPAGAAVAELEGYAAGYERAAAGGDERAAARLTAVRSYVDMIAIARGDEQIAELFVEFARADQAAALGVPGGVA